MADNRGMATQNPINIPVDPELRRDSPQPGRGRPFIGQPINVRLAPDDLRLIDSYAKRQNQTRAETIREIVHSWCTSPDPW